jgi:ubiquinone/menaquinone biosynthesis C-methylase UbiE
MIKERIVETNEGIQNELTVEAFDAFARGMRDRGLMHTDAYIKSGICGGSVLEIGPGPGYVGLEWLKVAPKGTLTGLEISPAMICIAQNNAREYGFEARASYLKGNCLSMPFADSLFDGVISNSSMHEWESPQTVFSEISRVLKPGGRFCIGDLRRNISPFSKWMMLLMCRPKQMRPGFLSSLNAAYTGAEIRGILVRTDFKTYSVQEDFTGITVTGIKE